MSAARVQRAATVLDVRQRAVDEAQTRNAEALRTVDAAARAAQAAQSAWETATRSPTGAAASSVDLAERDAWHRSLRLRADRAAAQYAEARAVADHARAMLVAAQSEFRKIEMWRDGLVAELRSNEARQERRDADTMAAQTVRKQR